MTRKDKEIIDSLINDDKFRLYVECGILHHDKNIRLYFLLKLAEIGIERCFKKRSYHLYFSLIFSVMHYFSLSSIEIKKELGITSRKIPTIKSTYPFYEAVRRVVAGIVQKADYTCQGL